MVLPLMFRELDSNDLENFVGTSNENQAIDFKEYAYPEPPDANLPTDPAERARAKTRWKESLCKDISALANAYGGLIVCGIHERGGVATEVCGLGAAINVENEIARLEQAARAGITPPVPNLHIYPVSLPDPAKSKAIVIRVLRSFAAPHRVKESSKFYYRRSNRNDEMDVAELRTAFNLSEAYVERVRRFRSRRIALINDEADDEETPVLLPRGTRYVLHVVPLTISDPTAVIDLNTVRSGRYGEQWFHYRMAYARFNFDGVIIPGGLGEEVGEYTQVFRSGAIETVDVTAPISIEGQSFLTFTAVEAFGLHSLRRSLAMSRIAQLTPPLVVALSLCQVHGCKLVDTDDIRNNHLPNFPPPPIRHDNLLFPEIVIDDYAVDYKNVMKPVFDTLWNAGARAHSESYDLNGNWAREIDEI